MKNIIANSIVLLIFGIFLFTVLIFPVLMGMWYISLGVLLAFIGGWAIEYAFRDEVYDPIKKKWLKDEGGEY